MRVFLSAYGTRGDVQPFVALAKALMARGHDTVLCTPTGFRPLVDRHHVPYAHMNNAVFELTEAALRARTGAEQRQVMRGFGQAIRDALADEARAALDFRPDVLVYHSKALASHHVAEKLGVPEFLAMALPLSPTCEFPAPPFPDWPLGNWYRRFTYRVLSLGYAIWSGATNDLREKTLGLPRLPRFADTMKRRDGSAVPALYGFSEAVLPRPRDWTDETHVTGAWFLDDETTWSPPPALDAFLADGPPPVYVGFGSMGAAHGTRLRDVVLEAIAESGERAVLASGWGGIAPSSVPEHVFLLEEAPHDWLFPRMRAIVHHGGAGSTMASLRAGKPTIICPFIADQPFWGRVVERAGLGPRALPQSSLRADALAAAMRATRAADMTERAARVGATIRSEQGTERAVDILEAAHRGAAHA